MGEDVLAELGYEVTSRMNSREALALLRGGPLPIRSCHYRPDHARNDGRGVCQEILAMRPDMPIIMCTGYSHLVDADKAKAAGIKAFVMKPLTKSEIARTIRRALDE